MLTSLGNSSVGHRCSAFLGFELPGVEQVQGSISNSVKSNIWAGKTIWFGKTSALPQVVQSLYRHYPCIFGRKHSAISVRTSMSCPSGSVRFERGMFNSDANVEKVKGRPERVDESKDDEEDAGLIPYQWRILQDNLHKTKKDKKADLRLQFLENEMRRAAELYLKRRDLENASKLFKERVEHGAVSNHDTIVKTTIHTITEHNVVRQGTIASLEVEIDNKTSQTLSNPVIEHNMKSQETITVLKVEEANKSSQNCEPREKRRFDSELNRLFSEDEIACLKRSAPDLSRIYCGKWPPLQVLVASGQFFFLDEFLKSSVDLNSVDEDGYTPIHRAILGRKETAVSQLLRAGADVNIHDKGGASFLHYSVQTGSLNLVRLFVKYGVDMNHSDEDGWTPLHVAALTAREDIVRHLLIRGADTHLKTKDGYTPFDICLAIGKGYRTFAVAKLLKRRSKENMPTATELECEEDSTPKEQRDAS